MARDRPRLRLEGFAGVHGSLELGYGVIYSTGASSAEREAIPRLLYALWLPVQPLPPRGYAESLAEAVREAFGGDPGGSFTLEGCGVRLVYRGGGARVEASFDPGERVESDERIVDSVKRFCFGSTLARRMYRGDVQRCLDDLREGWAQVLVHEALMCGLVRYAPEPHSGLPRATPPSLLGPERVCGGRKPGDLERIDPLLYRLSRPIRGGVEEAGVAPILAEAASLIGGGRSLLAVIEPGLGLHPRSARLAAWILLRIASRGVTVAASTASETLLSEARLQVLLYELYRRRPATASEAFSRIIRGLGVEIDAKEAVRLANSVLGAGGPVRILYVTGGELREATIQQLLETLPGLQDDIERQVGDLLEVVEAMGA